MQTYSSGGVTAKVSDITVHPDYDESIIDNDIAVWTLSEPIEEGDNISFATLPDQGSDPKADETVTVAGWYVLYFT